MSDLARLTIDLARAVGASRVVALGCRAPERLVAIADALELVAFDDREPLRELEALGASTISAVEWDPGGSTAVPLDRPSGTLVVCDSLLEHVPDPTAILRTVRELLDEASGAIVSTPDRALAKRGQDQARDGWDAAGFENLLADAALEPAWVGLTDSVGDIGERAALTCVLAGAGDAAIDEALAGGPFGLAFDPAVAEVGRKSRGSARVCIASYEFVGPTRTGGIGTAYSSLAEALARAGHEVTVLFTGWDDPSGRSFEHWVAHYRGRGIELHRLPVDVERGIETGHPQAARSFAAYRWLREREGNFDVIHFPETVGHGYYVVRAKRQGIAFGETTIVVGTHSPTTWVLETNGIAAQALHDFADDFIERESVAGADVVISPSAYMLDWMRSKGWRLPERSFVQQYVGSAAAGPHGEPAGSVPDTLPGGAGEIVFFGRLETRKGLRLFCDALDVLVERGHDTGLDVTFLGRQALIDGSPAENYVAERAKRWRWPWRIVDDLGQPEALAYLRAPGRRVAVMPSLADNSPNTVYEALELGIPFIASRIGGTAELIAPRDVERCTFDARDAADVSQSGRSDRGAAGLADRLSDALATPAFEPPRRSIDRDANREAHVRWHAAVAAGAPGHHGVASSADAKSRAANAGGSRVSVVIVGAEEDSTRTSDSLRGEHELLGAVTTPHDRLAVSVATAPGDLMLVVPAGAVMAPGGLATLVSVADRTEADFVTSSVGLVGEDGDLVRVPVGGPVEAGLFTRCLGDLVWLARRAALDELGGIDASVAPELQAHHLLCRAALAGKRIEPVPEVLATGLSAGVVGGVGAFSISRLDRALTALFADAPDHVLRRLPLVAQQLWAIAGMREMDLHALYEHRFGRLTIPVRWVTRRMRRLRATTRRSRGG